MLKKAKVHIYTLYDHEGYICMDVDGVALYEHFVRGGSLRTSFTTHMSGFRSLIKAVEGLQVGANRNNFTLLLTGNILIDVVRVERSNLTAAEQERIAIKLYNYLSNNRGWNFYTVPSL
jgi:hypothetical protein